MGWNFNYFSTDVSKQQGQKLGISEAAVYVCDWSDNGVKGAFTKSLELLNSCLISARAESTLLNGEVEFEVH